MNLTINTDASFREDLQIGGFAFWIVTDQGKIQKAGELSGNVKTSTHAELQSIGNALHTLKHSKFKGITKVYLNTDSKDAIAFLNKEAYPKCKELRRNLDECNFLMMEICIKYGFRIRDIKTFFEFKHVKAHNGKNDHRSYVNDWCDKQAKIYCRQLAKKLEHGS